MRGALGDTPFAISITRVACYPEPPHNFGMRGYPGNFVVGRPLMTLIGPPGLVPLSDVSTWRYTAARHGLSGWMSSCFGLAGTILWRDQSTPSGTFPRVFCAENGFHSPQPTQPRQSLTHEHRLTSACCLH